jgi:hypothetical protein
MHAILVLSFFWMGAPDPWEPFNGLVSRGRGWTAERWPSG